MTAAATLCPPSAARPSRGGVGPPGRAPHGVCTDPEVCRQGPDWQRHPVGAPRTAEGLMAHSIIAPI